MGFVLKKAILMRIRYGIHACILKELIYPKVGDKNLG